MPELSDDELHATCDDIAAAVMVTKDIGHQAYRIFAGEVPEPSRSEPG